VRGPRGTGLSKQEIIDTFERRLHNHPDFELQECLRNIHRIAELRLNDKFGVEPVTGNLVWDWHENWRSTAMPAMPRTGQLTVTYLTDAHRACAAQTAGACRTAASTTWRSMPWAMWSAATDGRPPAGAQKHC
jgi:N-carbamoyl-L-amino-acid hydrolase